MVHCQEREACAKIVCSKLYLHSRLAPSYTEELILLQLILQEFLLSDICHMSFTKQNDQQEKNKNKSGQFNLYKTQGKTGIHIIKVAFQKQLLLPEIASDFTMTVNISYSFSAFFFFQRSHFKYVLGILSQLGRFF